MPLQHLFSSREDDEIRDDDCNCYCSMCVWYLLLIKFKMKTQMIDRGVCNSRCQCEAKNKYNNSN